jgi:hypothetical protein
MTSSLDHYSYISLLGNRGNIFLRNVCKHPKGGMESYPRRKLFSIVTGVRNSNMKYLPFSRDKTKQLYESKNIV